MRLREAQRKNWDEQRPLWTKRSCERGDRIAIGRQFAKLIGMPKRDRDLATYHYLGKLVDEDRLDELKLPPAVVARLGLMMIEAGWVK
jgi:hypothetical protein